MRAEECLAADMHDFWKAHPNRWVPCDGHVASGTPPRRTHALKSETSVWSDLCIWLGKKRGPHGISVFQTLTADRDPVNASSSGMLNDPQRVDTVELRKPDTFAKAAAPFLLGLGPKDNGQSLTAPG